MSTPPEQLEGSEPVGDSTVSAFWRWAYSDLVGNTLRGVFAEWLVARACGVADGVRIEWAVHDLEVAGRAVEVKSSSYVQSWNQKRPSDVGFAIGPTKEWKPETGYAEVAKRHANVYVFCLLGAPDSQDVNPRDLEQWRFFVLPTRVLDEKVPTQGRIGLSSLLGLEPEEVGHGALRSAILRAVGSEGG